MNEKKKLKPVVIEDQNAELSEALEKQKKRERRKVWTRNVLIVGLIVVIILLLLCKCTGEGTPCPSASPSGFDVTLDPNAGDPTKQDPALEIDKLNKKLEEGYMTFSVNKTPVFPDGKSEGYLNIVNLEENNYPQVVEIYKATKNDNDEWVFGEKIYQSGMIPVGKAVEWAKLDVVLPAGEHTAMAVINSVDSETGAVLGTVNTPLKITVKS